MKINTFIDVNGITFGEDGKEFASWIQAMTLGTYEHPDYGKIEFTADRLKTFADGVNKRITGVIPDIDYDHKKRTDIAAGWVQQAEVRDDGLWIFVEWTPKAYEAIKNKEYKYFSPEFVDSWTHPKSGQTFSDVLRGGALTNRPFLKDIKELQLTEESDEFMTKEQIKFFTEKLNLKLNDNASQEDIIKAIMAALENHKSEENSTEGTEGNTNTEGSTTELSETEKSKLLADPVTAKFFNMMETQSKLLTEQTAKNAAMAKKFHDIDVEGKISKLNEVATTKGVVIPTAVKDMIKKFFDKADEETSGSVVTILSEFIKVGVASTGEIGNGDSGGSGDDDAVIKFTERINTLMEEKKLSFTEAAIQLSSDDPEGFAVYRNGSYSG